MFSLTIIVGIVLGLWLGGFAFYLYLSHKQEGIAESLDSVKHLLDQGLADSGEE